MKKAFLLFFLSLFLFIFPQPINANHVSECGSVCGGGTCKPNEEFCSFEIATFCMLSPKCPASTPTTKPPTAPTPTTGPLCGVQGNPCCNGVTCNSGLTCDGFGRCQVFGTTPTSSPRQPTLTPSGPTPITSPGITSTPIPTPNSGTCELKRLNAPGGRNELVNNCTPGYKPDPIPGNTNKCTCILDSIQICSMRGKDCTKDSGCNTQPDCNNYICRGFVPGRMYGKCTDSTSVCLKTNSNCSVDSDCQNGSQGCSSHTCWTIGKSKMCQSGKSPIALLPTRAPVLPPCAEWGVWNGSEYIKPDNIKNYQNDNGTFKDGANVNCIKFQTAIGDINPGQKTLVARIFGLVLGLSGGIALILFIVSGYRFMTSGGSPEAFQAARDMLVSAIAGLLFIIFSFVILEIIGVDILHIPGFE